MIRGKNFHKAIAVGGLILLSVFFWLLASSLVGNSKGKRDTPQTNQQFTKQVSQEYSWNVDFGQDVKFNSKEIKLEVADSKIRAFAGYYRLNIPAVRIQKISKKSTNVFLTDKIGDYQFILDSIGSVVGFISDEQLSQESAKLVGKSFSNINLDENNTLYIGSLTNGLLFRGTNDPLIKIKDLEKFESNMKVSLQRINQNWEHIERIIEGDNKKKFNRFVKSPTGVHLAEYILNNGDRIYYSLYVSRNEKDKEIVLGEFSGYQKYSYDEDMTRLFIENMSQFGVFKVGERGILWIRY